MTDTHTIEPALHPKHKLGFLIDWLVTLKCNFNCAYCEIGPRGHDNSTQHPPFEKCITMLKQMYLYTDLVMQYKKNNFKDAVLNVYGGESLYHPEIEKILEATEKEFEQYSSRWALKRRITTNASASEKKWKNICNFVEGITFSYHSESPKKMKLLFKKNIDQAIKYKKQYDIIVCMYPHVNFWKDCLVFLEYCVKNKLNVRPRLLDGNKGIYSKNHFNDLLPYLKNFDQSDITHITGESKFDTKARACCGGRPLCKNRDLKNSSILVTRDSGFQGWHCSANQFFLFGNNVSGEYFTNKDCRVKLDRTAGPIATIDTMENYLQKIKKQAEEEFGIPTLQCVQNKCLCGTCAPKSLFKNNLQNILKIYNVN